MLILLLLLLPSSAIADALTREEQSLAKFLVGDSAQHRSRGEMQLDPILTAVARARAGDLATRRYFSHVNPDGHGPNYMLCAAGYGLPAFWGTNPTDNCVESIGAGYATPEDAWAGWMKSSSHRSHLLAQNSFYRNQTSYGVGFYSDPSSAYRRYWVIITAPPNSRGDARFVSHRSEKPARVAVSVPVQDDADAEGTRTNASKTAPRSRAIRPTAAEKLWNWEGPVSVPRPPATRPIGGG